MKLMRLIFVVAALVLFALLSLAQANLAKAEAPCKEGDRRICGSDVGICRSGRSVCKDGNWTGCEGGVRPGESEICGNGLDDDCNRMIDEGCFPWVSLILIGTGMLFIGIGMYYMQRERGERLLSGGVSKD
jgi:hypothetical protein